MHQDPREQNTSSSVHVLQNASGYKATKVIFLKREDGSSRCGLEEAVVTAQPGWEGPSGTWGDNQGAEGAPPPWHCPEGG